MAGKGLGARIGEKAVDASRSTVETAKTAAKKVNPTDLHGPSPNVRTNLAIADIALRGGSMVARLALERAFLGNRYAPRKAKRILKGRSIGETMLHAGLARLALTSVPGAIIVGGGLIAKTLYDRSRARVARAEGEQALQEMAERGEKEE